MRGLLHSDAARVVTGLVAGLALGILVSSTGGAGSERLVSLVAPVGVLWVNAIRMTVIPLVVSLLITGIASVAEQRALGQLGRRTIATFAALLVVSAVVAVTVVPALFTLFPEEWVGRVPLPPGAEQASRDLGTTTVNATLSGWITSLIPVNPIAAAAAGNMVSLLVFVALLALAIVRVSPDSRRVLVDTFRAVGDAMLVLVGWIVRLAPLAVFALVLPLASQAGAALVGAAGFYILALVVACIIATLVHYPMVRLLTHIRTTDYARAVMPAQVIGASCSSSVASLPAMLQSASALGVPTRESGFVLPLAVSIFKPAAGVMWVTGAIFIGKFYAVPVGPRELGIIGAAAVLVSFAAPGVPRGAFLMLTPLFTAIGLPAEGIGVLIALDLIPDMAATVVNVTGQTTAAVLVSGRGTRPTSGAPTSSARPGVE